MAGGSGTRLWPLSRAGFPKQFLVLSGIHSLFQLATARLTQGEWSPSWSVAAPLIVGNEEHRFLILDQLRDMKTDPGAVLLEPMGRNTAAALTLAALQAVASGDDPVLVVTPADQTVTDPQAFAQSLNRAVAAAAKGSIIILGVTPDRPETGYGYIRCVAEEAAEASPEGASSAATPVAEFVEKPDLATAQRYLESGHYSWNSGLFVLKASVWLAALTQFRPDILQACEAAWALRQTDGPFVRPDREAFALVPSESVDYAVMERCPGSAFDIRRVALAAGWNDLGAWDAVWQVADKDGDGNAVQGDVLVEDSRNTLVHATSRLVSVIGLDDVVVVETADAVLVADRARSQEVKKIVTRLSAQDRGEPSLHRKVSRPWGWYDSIDAGPRFQVKRILVKPGASLSLQMHHHRAEHWVVVSGTAEVTCGERKILLTENQSTYIPLGEVHRLSNPGRVPLEIIEVQSGSYLGEDDITRFEDTYGRQ
ncbi:mannose-1-phosphate guanylyltransferase/mannose-6-phosphate isomerase [Leptothrix ochracea]|uniref:mannose-1-phosphate guanylyltransferase/mannose-6-phosphate isomerase n=1 Tax=Leptothrix ochracea TaxID=735331 RepID=UPI0034E22630